MKSFLRAAAFVLISLQAFAVHARTYSQGELDALLAPVALYPDPLLTHVLNAAAFPQDVASAAEWRRANPHHSADQALRDVEGYLWHPSVKALVAQPDVLSRLAESPEWLAALGEAYLGQPQQVHATVQQLRVRAQSTGSLASDQHQQVYQQGETIVVQPVYPNVVYAPYYNPYIVYGAWWWPHYHPVYFRPWVPRPVYVNHFVPVVPLRPVATPLVPVARPVVPVRPAPVMRQPVRQPLAQQRPQVSRAMPAPTLRATPSRAAPYRAVPEARRAPIVNSHAFQRGTPVAGNAFRSQARLK